MIDRDTAVMVRMIWAQVIMFGKPFKSYFIEESSYSPINPRFRLGARKLRSVSSWKTSTDKRFV